VLNATNEVCVSAFLRDKIKFTEMSRIIERALQSVDYQLSPTLDQLIATDSVTRRIVEGWL
jgi:1-deoxy-D-xylulose-5-phosphate reductoisomerase